MHGFFLPLKTQLNEQLLLCTSWEASLPSPPPQEEEKAPGAFFQGTDLHISQKNDEAQDKVKVKGGLGSHYTSCDLC